MEFSELRTSAFDIVEISQDEPDEVSGGVAPLVVAAAAVGYWANRD